MAAILSATGRRVGHGGAGLVEVGGRRLATGASSGAEAARSVLIHPGVEAAVLEVARREVLAEGLGFDHCDVGVVAGLDESLSAAEWGFEDPEDVLRAERCVVDVVLPGGWAVLRGDDPRIAAMAESCRGGVILAATDGTLPALLRATRRGRSGRLRPGRGDRPGRGWSRVGFAAGRRGRTGGRGLAGRRRGLGAGGR